MKIFCVGRNYVEHAEELKNEVPTSPLIFMKPPTALLLENKPFFYPEFSDDIHYEGEIVIKIAKNGKYIQPAFAKEYYNKMAYGIDFTARDLQSSLKEKGHPWELAKGFDYSAAVSGFIDIGSSQHIYIKTILNEEVVQESCSDKMIFSINEIIVYLSQFYTLQQGDMIFTGTPAGVGKVKIGDVIEGQLNNQTLLRCKIK